jgi:hypothetical protein
MASAAMAIERGCMPVGQRGTVSQGFEAVRHRQLLADLHPVARLARDAPDAAHGGHLTLAARAKGTGFNTPKEWGH